MLLLNQELIVSLNNYWDSETPRSLIGLDSSLDNSFLQTYNKNRVGGVW